MSNFRAIATVTATLQRVLQDAIHSDVAGSTVSTLKPTEAASAALPASRVNVYLYSATQNPHRSNLDLPTRRPDGGLAQRPQVALDLNYLLSFYGDDATLEPQRLLGSVVAFLHSQPLITRPQIEAVVQDASKPFLAQSDLANQPELVRFTPLPMSLEELSRLWSVMLQTEYVLSVVYRASVVLVEPQLSPQPALPARAFNLAAIPLRQPFIHQIVADAGDAVPILPGSRIRIVGANLSGLATQAQIELGSCGHGGIGRRPYHPRRACDAWSGTSQPPDPAGRALRPGEHAQNGVQVEPWRVRRPPGDHQNSRATGYYDLQRARIRRRAPIGEPYCRRRSRCGPRAAGHARTHASRAGRLHLRFDGAALSSGCRDRLRRERRCGGRLPVPGPSGWCRKRARS